MITAWFIYAMAAVLLVFSWTSNELELRTKLIMTLIYGTSWLFLLLSPWVVVAAQALYSAILGLMTFGPDFRR